ncbi:hypothetical protein [Gemmobacter serpentinus]|uniref:hypothetical protein n=1 Tax=Gemmobacter serpentinus TaxID=2652247 RepID=UPI00124D6733|nr:hypothetical protein [Gemmobacter serpentinus]
MPRKPPVSKEYFEAVVAKVTKRAEHLLAREATTGIRSSFLGTEKPSETEFFDRLIGIQTNMKSLLDTSLKLAQDETLRLGETMDRGPRTSLSVKLSSLEPAAQKEYLIGLVEYLGSYLEMLHEYHREHLRRAAAGHEIAELLTADELEPDDPASVACDDPDPPVAIMSAENARAAADLARHIESVMRLQSDSRSLLAGRFDATAKREGRIERRRGRSFAIHLIGYAEGMGLTRSRNHYPAPKSPLHSAIDAYLCALSRLAQQIEPAAAAVLTSAPDTFEAVLRHHIPALKNNEELLKRWKTGWALGQREMIDEPKN